MTFKDLRGETLSTVHAASAMAYDHTLDLLNSFRADPLAAITPVLAQDPDFISGHLLLAGMMLGTYDPNMNAPALASLDNAAASALAPTAREQSLHAALRAWADGDMIGGSRRLDRHLIDHPRDLLALQLAHTADLALGYTTMLRDRIARALPAWSESDASYGYVLGMQAFGLEECFAYDQAEEVGRRAVSLQPHDTWAVHAVAHVCEMQGRADDGIQWMNETRGAWEANNGLAVHNHWHLALMHLSRGEHAAALALYDKAVAPAPTALALDLADASALLWRLVMRGVDVGPRWLSLAQRWRTQGVFGAVGFLDVHAAISLAAAGDREGMAQLMRAGADAAARPGAFAEWSAVAMPASEAITAMVAGEHTRCLDLLMPVLPVAQALGGSHAQRDLLTLTAQEAAQRGGHHALASALKSQRQVHHLPFTPQRSAVLSRASRRAISLA
ncbi:tetratricopeptide repeat protein [Hydrogenophaga sp.]|uniref:tetratricopeptide repeat protein n=1 Tax=Hydrogenophaga sp. TaxID=1904254 RepID=UPI0025C33A8F|nr:tetratricopeptide repeat protein [Hydrogenophaga sp.]MBT9464446.1 tetratricopeptide repeat protein [Hydrogenophaga sp.]